MKRVCWFVWICGGFPEILQIFFYQKWGSKLLFSPQKSWSQNSKCDPPGGFRNSLQSFLWSVDLANFLPPNWMPPKNSIAQHRTDHLCKVLGIPIEPQMTRQFLKVNPSPKQGRNSKIKTRVKGHLSSRYMQKESMPGMLRKTVIWQKIVQTPTLKGLGNLWREIPS